ncbi:S1C family serine protease [Lignipirellula cremea]|uniref:Serine protease HtrA n=1 Tax=Lignipirellula cremea TaxID=2528010 RepID=A0A518DQP3_9BACT|nr:trypsin-like peptidase domain-containing protein [Lignipirellula cremea]QDU94158.1 Putative serine protease HtrA [Lignipirellula cremea]
MADNRSLFRMTFLNALLTLLLAAMLVWQVVMLPTGKGIDPLVEMRPQSADVELTSLEQSTIDIFRRVSPSVVHITTLVNARRSVFSFDNEQIEQGSGSGFLWDNQGHVVTNFHVIQNADAAQITLANHATYPGRLVGAYPDKDLAVLTIDAPPEELRQIALGTSRHLEVGQSVLAIGNPFGLDQTLTTGVVSAVGRQIRSVNNRTIRDVIQTDAAINPGNSGGPLLDSSGRLIGVNSSILSPSGAFAGVGFAIPIDEVNRVVTELIRHGKIVRPSFGVELAPDQWRRYLQAPGVLVLNVEEGSPAAKAGILPTRRAFDGEIELGDFIVSLDDQPINSTDDYLSALESKAAGDAVKVVVRRGRTEKTFQLQVHSGN